MRNNSYTLEIDSSACIIIADYERNLSGLKKALMAVESYSRLHKLFSAKIICSKTKEEVWSISYANPPEMG